ncbi:hypothetical protein [Deinococcus aquiradiocola]|uniref:Uncharacterized protein n=1 Tax=Deinococcus aquiradiocola TaxID=393059 RepID=A0A917PRN0_9DEIO|nr:hypothetical protein [Deinococcus aquiradiocola]GGJ88623.1 hypothetical protein GCM10008939_35880 [Deinococcus aquiradiocola]
MNLSRQALGMIGLIVGFGLYGLAGRLHSPWNEVLIGSVFAALGVTAFVYARGERWIQALGALLFVYGLVRAFLLR